MPACYWILIVFFSASFVYSQEVPAPQPGVKQLFLDDYLIREVHNLSRVLHQPEKVSPEPVIRPEHSWESVIVSTRNAPFWDPAEQVWKLYYRVVTRIEKVSGQTRGPADYNTDVYNMPIFPYGGVYIGTPMFFNQSGPTPIGNSEGFHHVELVTSRDLIRWQ